MSDDDFDAVIRVHLRGTFNWCRAARKPMVEAKYGRIINISSRSAYGNPGQANYSTAKAGILGLTATVAADLGRFWHHGQRGRARLRRYRHNRGNGAQRASKNSQPAATSSRHTTLN
jgi:nucleoside-diphosphate-sugar epimerase